MNKRELLIHHIQPMVCRFIERKYVEAFFDTGEIQLSSFAQFCKHDDEQRHDDKEGWNINLIHSNNETTTYAVIQHGMDAIVLCGTTSRSTAPIWEEKGADTAITAFDATAFAGEIAEALGIQRR